MTNTVVVGNPIGQNPTTYPCVVNGNWNCDVVVTQSTIDMIPNEQLGTYIEARALLVYGDSAGATSLVQPLANGDEINPNWAQQWIDGNIPS